MHDAESGKQLPACPGSRSDAWLKGIREFNSQRYWEAHAHWETGWKELEWPQREHVQALIQAAGAFHLLIERKRFGGALSLSRSALRRRATLKEGQAMVGVFPRIEVPGLDAVLRTIVAGKKLAGKRLDDSIEAIRALRARLSYGRDVKTVR